MNNADLQNAGYMTVHSVHTADSDTVELTLIFLNHRKVTLAIG